MISSSSPSSSNRNWQCVRRMNGRMKPTAAIRTTTTTTTKKYKNYKTQQKLTEWQKWCTSPRPCMLKFSLFSAYTGTSIQVVVRSQHLFRNFRSTFPFIFQCKWWNAKQRGDCMAKSNANHLKRTRYRKKSRNTTHTLTLVQCKRNGDGVDVVFSLPLSVRRRKICRNA